MDAARTTKEAAERTAAFTVHREIEMTQTCNWLTHSFYVYPHNTSWNDVAGIYIFCSVVNNRWLAHYIGQASSFSDRLSNHERFREALMLGMTHIHALTVPAQADRDRIEKALIQSYQPRLNTLLK